MSLFRRNASDTSIEAGQSIDANRLEKLVLRAIQDAGAKGMTQSELLSQFPHLSYSSVTARPSALKRKGLIVDSGQRRPGPTGRKQAVLIGADYAA